MRSRGCVSAPDCAQYWESYDKFGLWKDRTIMAHCVHSDARERSAIRQAGVVVAHCPDSNINLCSGIAPVRQMLNEGLWVTLGSDIAAGSSLSGSQMVTMSIRASKIRRFTDPEKPAFLTVPEAYYLGTTSGHRYFGAGNGFAAGDRLHAVVVDDRDFTETPRGAQPVRAPRARAVHDDRRERLRGMVGGPVWYSTAARPHPSGKPPPARETRMISAPFYGILSAG